MTRKTEAVSAVAALQHADWLGLALGVVRRGPGHVTVLDLALLQLAPGWQGLGVLDPGGAVSARGGTSDGVPPPTKTVDTGRSSSRRSNVRAMSVRSAPRYSSMSSCRSVHVANAQ